MSCLLHIAKGKPCERHRECHLFPPNPPPPPPPALPAKYISTQDGWSCFHMLQRAPSRMQHPLSPFLIPLPLELPRGVKCPSTFFTFLCTPIISFCYISPSFLNLPAHLLSCGCSNIQHQPCGHSDMPVLRQCQVWQAHDSEKNRIT